MSAPHHHSHHHYHVHHEKYAYPETKRGDKVEDFWGTKVEDPYQWLENPDAPEVEQWVEKQNEVTAAVLANAPRRSRWKSD